MSKTRIINQYLLSAKSKGLKRLHSNTEQAYFDLCAALKKKYSKCEEVAEGSALKIEHTFHNETKNCYFVYKKSSSIARHYVSVFTLETGTAGLELLEEVCNTVFKTDSVLSNYYDIIVLRDGISEKYSNRIFPKFNEYERKLKALMFAVYTQEYGSAYIQVVQSHVENSIKGAPKNKKELSRVQEMFFALTLGDIQNVLFTPYWSPADENYYYALLNDSCDYSKCSNEEIRQLFSTLKPKCDWDKFFAKLFREEDMPDIIDELRNYRNLVAHCKSFSTEQYIASRELLKKAIKQLDKALNSIAPRCHKLMDNIEDDDAPCGSSSSLGQISQDKFSHNSARFEAIARSIAEAVAMASNHSSIDTDITEPLRYIPPKRIGRATKQRVKPHYHRKSLKK